MNEFDWNSLRVGDRVIVHEHRRDAPVAGCDGTVAFVTQRRRHNAVGLRLEGHEVRWLTRFEVERRDG